MVIIKEGENDFSIKCYVGKSKGRAVFTFYVNAHLPIHITTTPLISTSHNFKFLELNIKFKRGAIMDKVLTANNVQKDYKSGKIKVSALKKTTIDINHGEIVVIIGKSGSGKSTLLNVLGGLIKPDSGQVLLSGKSLYDIKEKQRAEIRNTDCGFIYQNFNLINELSVINNIRLPFDIAGRSYEIKREKELLSLLGLENRKTFYPCQLSGGEKQRVAIARALLIEPSVILADEPTGNLDLDSGKKLMEFIKQTNEQQKQTYIVVTHDLEWLKIAHTVYRMSDGVLTPEVK